MRRRRARTPGRQGWHAAIDEHCRRLLGPWPTAFGEIVPSSGFRITIYPHAAGPSRPFQTVRTAGASDYPMHVPPGSTRPRHCELPTYIPPDWDLPADEEGWWPAALLKLLGQFVHEHETSFDIGHTILVTEPGDTYAQGTLVGGVLLRAPAEPGGFDPLDIDGVTCRFLWAFPITHGEVDFKLRNGADALLALIAEHARDQVLDPRRPCFVTGARADPA